MIRIEVDDRAVQTMLHRLQQSVGNLQPAMAEIGATLNDNIRMGFKDSRDPLGTAWKRLSKVTATRRKGGAGQPLLDTGRLRNSITYRATGNSVEVGTNVKYATTHQFGAAQGAFGRTRRGGPIPWGHIPARPFMPITDNGKVWLPAAWQEAVIDILQRRLMEAER